MGSRGVPNEKHGGEKNTRIRWEKNEKLKEEKKTSFCGYQLTISEVI